MEDKKKAAIGAGAIILLGVVAFAATRAAPALAEVEKKIAVSPEDQALLAQLEQARAEALAAKLELSEAEGKILGAITGAEFTGSYGQLDMAEQLVPKETVKAALNEAYNRASREADEKNETIVYSKDEGYSSKTYEEMQAMTKYPIWM